MAEQIAIEHTTFALMGPIQHTRTVKMPCHCVIFRIGERVVLLDTGFGNREMLHPNSLLGDDILWRLFPLIDPRLTAFERLKLRGIRPEQVTDIVLTHMDYDHIGGLHDFPNATVHVSAEELTSFEGSQPRGAYRRYQVSHLTHFKTYESTGERWFDLEARSLALSEDLQIKLIPLPGHTRGHCGVAYREEGKWSLHAGDAYFDSQVNFINPPPGLSIEIAFQTSADNRIASLGKLRRLREEHAAEVALYCTHDQQEFESWTVGRGVPDQLTHEML